MKRVIVIGCPGSGKSTFARTLHNKTGLPLYYLDQMFWNEDKTTVEKQVFLERLSALLVRDAWIIDGNYASTMARRMAASDTVIFLDYPTEICLEGIRARRGKSRPDMPWIEVEEDAEFVAFVEHFHEQERPKILELLAQSKDKTLLVFKSREEADAFLNQK